MTNLSPTEKKVLDQCENLLEDTLAFTKALIRQPSVLGNEKGALDVAQAHLEKLGFPVRHVPIDPVVLSQVEGFADVPWSYEGRYNLASSLNERNTGNSLILNGHLDVVPPGDEDQWTRNPFDPWIAEGQLFGRGAGDMKSGIAAMIYALRAIHKCGISITSPLQIQLVIEEESSGNGAMACALEGIPGDFALIPEPFGLSVLISQIGVCWFKVVYKGLPAHVLSTTSGINAIEALFPVIASLKKLEDDLNTSYRWGPYLDHPHPFNLNIGKIAGGDWPSSVPSYAEFDARIGFPPDMAFAEIQAKVLEAVASPHLSHVIPDKPEAIFYGFRSEGYVADTRSEPFRQLFACHEDLNGVPPQEYIATCTTDLRALHRFGKTIATCYGPTATNIHGFNEGVSIESILQTMKCYALFMLRWCSLQS